MFKRKDVGTATNIKSGVRKKARRRNFRGKSLDNPGPSPWDSHATKTKTPSGRRIYVQSLELRALSKSNMFEI